MLLFLFWFFAFASIYSYFLYPVILIVMKKYRGAHNISPADLPPEKVPSVSLIVTAYNEERRIREKIENSLSLDYDKRKLEIIIASDCSDDLTDDIVKEYEEKGVKLVRAQERLGKENAQLSAIKEATGDILVFSDTATQIPEDSLWKLVAYFADPSIGAVSSEDRFISKGGAIAGEGAYVKYEMWLRQQESQLSGLVGLSGSFFAARKTICQEWDIQSPSDFNTALNAAKAGLRAISAADVLGFYTDLQDPTKEYQRKIRTVIRGMTGLSRHTEVMSLSRFGFFAIQVISHKLMRWLSPLFFIAFFLISAILADNGLFYALMFIGQLAFYGLASAAHFVPRLKNLAAIKLIYFFVQVHVALFDATLKFLSGQRMTTWKPSAR